jgi:hypothetical protein
MTEKINRKYLIIFGQKRETLVVVMLVGKAIGLP